MGLANQIKTKIRNIVNKVTRPSSVTEAQHKHLKEHPECAACGSIISCQAHHLLPYKKFPKKAADPSNFITLCEHIGGPEHHLNLGHAGNFKFYNPNLLADIETYKKSTDARRQMLLEEIKSKRLVDEP